MGKNLDAPVIAIYGRRGTGKTTMIKSLIEKRRRVLVLDPKKEYPNPVAWSDLSAMLERPEFRICYRPIKGSEPAALAKICRELEKNRTGRITLVIDELHKFDGNKAGEGLAEFSEAVLEGRHADIEIIGATQRPANVSTDFRGNAEISYIFGLSWANDVDAVCKMIGRQHRERLIGLVPHEFLRFEGGKLTQGKNALK